MSGFSGGKPEPFANIFGVNSTKLPKWQKAIARASLGLQNAVMACIGDSQTAGALGASPTDYVGAKASSYPAILSSFLSGSSGLPASQQSWWGEAHAGNSGVTITQYDPRVVLGANWAFVAAQNLPGGYPIGNSTSTTNLAFTPTVPVDTFDIYYLKNTTFGSFTTQVDAGAVSAPTSTTGAAGMAKLTVSTTLGTHTLNIARSSGGVVDIQATVAYNSAQKSILVWGMGSGGTKTADWVSTAAGFSNGNVIGSVIQADLWAVVLGANNMIASVSSGTLAADVATFTSELTTLVTNCKQSGDVILGCPYPLSTASVSQAIQDAYRAAIFNVAATQGLMVLDWQGLVTSWAQANADGFGTAIDPYHPLAPAYPEYAKLVSRAIGAI